MKFPSLKKIHSFGHFFLGIVVACLLTYNISDVYQGNSDSIYNGWKNDLRKDKIECPNMDCDDFTCDDVQQAFVGDVQVTSDRDQICVRGMPNTNDTTGLGRLEICLNTKSQDDKCGALCIFYTWTDYLDITLVIFIFWIMIKMKWDTPDRQDTIKFVFFWLDTLILFGLSAIGIAYCVFWGEAQEQKSEKDDYTHYNTDDKCFAVGRSFVWVAHTQATETEDFLNDDRQKAVIGLTVVILVMSFSLAVIGLVQKYYKPSAVKDTGKENVTNNPVFSESNEEEQKETLIASLKF